jgi:hypothetical protein
MTSATPGDRTPQEQLWAGEFGNDYIVRNRDSTLVESNRALLDKILSRTQGVTSAIEFGANIGNNLHALRDLLPEVDLHAVEINAAAAEIQAWGAPPWRSPRCWTSTPGASGICRSPRGS